MQNPNPSRSLLDFLNVHVGETAWLFGKGPSLDRFDMHTAGHLRCAISDVVQHVPDCRYCFANDSINAWHDLYRSGHILFQPRRTITDPTMQAPEPDCERIVFEDGPRTLDRQPTREDLATDRLSARAGTVCSAVQILHIMGVAQIIAVGCEGIGGRSILPSRTGMRADHIQDYAHIHREMLSTAHQLNLDLRVFGVSQPKPYQSHTHMKIRILENVALSGQHCEKGTVVEATKEDAAIAIAQGQAERFTEAQPPGKSRAKQQEDPATA